MKWICIIILSVFLTGCADTYIVYPVGVPCIYPEYKRYFGVGEDGYQVIVDHKTFNIPYGFQTDLASVPRPLWSFVSPFDARLIGASIMHDYLYSGKEGVSRKFADDVFYNQLVHDGSSKVKAWVFWSGVRMFGWMSFRG